VTPLPDIHGDLEAWALVSARLLRRPPFAAAGVIREAGVEAGWRDADARWHAELLTDLEAGRLDRVLRYRAVCFEVLEARRASGGAVPSPVDALAPPTTPATSTDTPAFARRLAPVGARPEPPRRAQAATSTDLRGADQELATERALSWPLERYAWLSAQLEHAPHDAERAWAAEGLHTSAARAAVLTGWARRFERDPELRARHDGLVRTYLGAMTAGPPRAPGRRP
jgi:hypothetical protein